MQDLLIAVCETLFVAYGIWVPDQGLNSGPLLWEHRVLATGPPGKSLRHILLAKLRNYFNKHISCIAFAARNNQVKFNVNLDHRCLVHLCI